MAGNLAAFSFAAREATPAAGSVEGTLWQRVEEELQWLEKVDRDPAVGILEWWKGKETVYPLLA